MKASLTALFLVGALASSRQAFADVKYEGTWPDHEPEVTVAVDGTRDEVLRALAAKAGWSVVMDQIGDAKPMTMHVEKVDAKKLFEALLADGDWVAKRDGTLVTITRAKPGPASVTAPADAAVPAIPTPAKVDAVPPPPVPPPLVANRGSDHEEQAEVASPPPAKGDKRDRDVEVFGNSLRIAKDETVRNVTVLGGSVDIDGHVTGNLSVLGGSAHLHGGSVVDGDASVTGGSIEVDPDARIDGNLGVLGGSIEGAENAKVGGSVKLDPSDGKNSASFIVRAGRRVADGMRSAALLFLLGVLFIALGGDRSETLRAEIAARPMKSLALGLVGLLGAFIVLVGLCITVIGIPVAFIGAVLGVVVLFAGITSALTVAGAAAAGHRSKNVYVHLAVGCALFFVAGLLPWIGGLLQLAVVLIGIGAAVATRVAGYVPRFRKSLPYREPA